jgi:hypothetical protein
VIGKAICETLTVYPSICATFETSSVVYEEERTSVIWTLFTYFYTLTIGLMILALICICIARRAARKDVNDEVKKSVAHYFSMREVESLQ